MTAVPERDTRTSRKEQAQWFLHRLVPHRGICNLAFAIAVDRQLRWWPLQEALNQLPRRHRALRAVFRASGSQIRKHFLPPDVGVPLTTLAETDDGLAARITDLTATPFDLAHGPLLRAYRIVLPARSVVCVALHHLVADAVSVGVIVRELTELYDAFAEIGSAPAGLDGPAGFYLEPDPEPAEVTYWVDHLAGVDPAAQALELAAPAPTRPTFAGDRVVHTLGADARRAIARLRTTNRTTENIVLLAAYYAMLARHGAGPVIAIGALADARRGDAHGVVGYHTNTLPIAVRIDADAGTASLIGTVRDAFLTGLEHGRVPFEAVQPVLASRSGDWRQPLFRHAFNYRPPAQAELRMAGGPVQVLGAYHGMSRVDLELIVFSGPDALTLDAVYSTETHRRDGIVALLRRYEATLVALAAADHLPIGALDIRSAADRQLVVQANATAREARPAGVLGDVLAAAGRTPDAPAVGGWTYRQMLDVARRVRTTLSGCGVGAGDLVGLYATRGPMLAASVLGIWLAGAAYLPMDPAHPAWRNAFQLDDAGARAVVADRPVPTSCATERALIRVDVLAAGPADHVTGPAHETVGPANLAYVIYTSGSTGIPKGVEISHASLGNAVRHFADVLDMTAADRMLWLTTYSFDISALELFLPLTVGGCVVVASEETRLDPDRLLTLIVDEQVSVVQGTPTTWRHLASRLDGRLRGRRVLCGGETLTASLAERLLADGCRLFNVYGPTETTIWSTGVELTGPPGDRVPIGLPIANTGAHVLDPAGRPVPPGLPGRLWISGAGLAHGYRGDRQRTAERFVTDPVLGRRYDTGDIVRQRPDGHLEFVGRADRQLKIRGHRVEPGEVENLLERHPHVAAAAVFSERGPDGHLRLVAAIQTTGQGNHAAGGPADGAALGGTLRDHLAEYLPEAVLPSRLALVPHLPLTHNGKVDHAATAALVAAAPTTAAKPELSRDPAVRALVDLWREVLADPGLDATSDFFLHGGHSLLAVQLAERITAELHRTVTFEMIFTAPSPDRLAVQLGGAAL